jgi:hypothetical protein
MAADLPGLGARRCRTVHVDAAGLARRYLHRVRAVMLGGTSEPATQRQSGVLQLAAGGPLRAVGRC